MNDYPLKEILLPMGAKEVKDEDKMEDLWDDNNYVAEEKYDGSRYLSVGGRFFSRRVSVQTNFPVEKTENVPHLTVIFKMFPQLILDGEVYYEGMSSNDVTSIMGALPEKAIARQQERGFLKYVAFDILRDIDGNWLLDKPWKERRAALEMTFDRIWEACFHVDIAEPTHIAMSRVEYKDKRGFYNKIMARNGEGVILKNVNGKYIPDKKPMWNWIKVKKHITEDVVIMGFKPPVREYEGKELSKWEYWEKQDITNDNVTSEKVFIEGGFGEEANEAGDVYREESGRKFIYTPVTKFYFYGWIGAVTFGKWKKTVSEDGSKVTQELVELGYCSGLTDELRKDMSENPEKYIGDCMEIGAMEQTKDGFFRHPQFSRMRPDKNPSECVIGG